MTEYKAGHRSDPQDLGDRRFMPRVRWDVPIRIEVDGQSLQCRCVDISQTGIRLRGVLAAYRGQLVRVFVPIDGDFVEADGEVVWSSNAPQGGWGVRFTSVHPSARRRIARFVIAQLRDRPQDEVVEAATGPARPPAAVPWTSARRTPSNTVSAVDTVRPSRSPAPEIRETRPAEPPAPSQPSPSPTTVGRAFAPIAAAADRPPWDKPEIPSAPDPEVLPCSAAMRHKLQELLDNGLASSAIVGGAKEAMTGRGDLYLRVDTGPVVVLRAEDPLVGRLRWLAAAVATWSENHEPEIHHGPETPLRILI